MLVKRLSIYWSRIFVNALYDVYILYNYFEFQTIFILSNTIILSKFLTNLSNIPIYQHFLHIYPSIAVQSSTSKLPHLCQFFNKTSNFLQNVQKSTLFPTRSHPLKSLKPKKSLENKGFFLLHSISRSHSTERHFIKSYFNYFVLQTLL